MQLSNLRRSIPAIALVILSAVGGTVRAQGVIKIGEIDSYKVSPAYLEPYKKGWEMAQDEVNAAGGVLGKKIEVMSRDDNGNPGDAVRVAEELFAREQINVFFGGFLSNIAVALSDFARNREAFMLIGEAGTDRIIWAEANKFTYRTGPSSYMSVSMLAKEAIAQKKKRWAFVYPNYELGQAATATFKKILKEAQPDVEFVAEQAPPLGKADAAAISQALLDAKPDAIFNVLFGADLGKFVREGNTRHLFDNAAVFSMFTGRPEYLDPLGAEAPVGWVVTGYPWYSLTDPVAKKFITAYQAKYKDYPRLGSIVGYSTLMSLVEGMKKAQASDPVKLAAAFKGLTVATPMGPITYRPQDNQSTMGAYVGKVALKDGKGVMVDYRYIDGSAAVPTDDEVKKLRVEH